MNFKILIILFLISCVYSASISGFIRDADTGEPLSYANIIILNSDIGVASNNNGYYIIPDISQALLNFLSPISKDSFVRILIEGIKHMVIKGRAILYKAMIFAKTLFFFIREENVALKVE